MIRNAFLSFELEHNETSGILGYMYISVIILAVFAMDAVIKQVIRESRREGGYGRGGGGLVNSFVRV